MCQQSPSFGSLPTGATSAHHLVTPTSARLAPIAHRIEVVLGASETIRIGGVRFALIATQENSRPRGAPRLLRPRIDSSQRVCCTASLIFRRPFVRIHFVVLGLLLPYSALAQTPSAPSKAEVVQY